MLAGVSATWYTWLEQGRNIRVSEGVLNSISNALSLDGTERAHLYRLAGINPPQATDETTVGDASRLQQVVKEWMHAPAFVIDRYWNLLAANNLARSVLNVKDQDYNYIVEFFTDPAAKHRYPRWNEMANRLVGQFRVQTARYPDDPHFERMATQLCAASTRFTELWTRHETWDSAITTVEVRSPEDGRLIRFEHMTLTLSECSDSRLILYMPSTPANVLAEP